MSFSQPSIQQFTVVPRDGSTSAEHTRQVLESAISVHIPEMRLIHIDDGVATVELPEEKLGHVRSVLGHEFMVDPNPSLKR